MASKPGVYMHIEGFDGFDRSVDFDKREIRKAMRRAGSLVTKASRKKVSRKSESKAGEYPGKRLGNLAKSIRAKVSRSGFMVRIEPKAGSSIPSSAPYFAYLFYGVKRGAVRRKDHRAQSSGPYRVEPRANYMTDALDEEAPAVRNLLSAALAAGLRIR